MCMCVHTQDWSLGVDGRNHPQSLFYLVNGGKASQPNLVVWLASLPWGYPVSSFCGWNCRQTATPPNIYEIAGGPNSGPHIHLTSA